MFKNTIFLLVFCLVCLLSSCRSTRQEKQTTIRDTKELSQQIVSYKDTTLFTPKTETSLKIPISELGIKFNLNTVSKTKKFSQRNGNANVKIQIVHDTIYATATCDSVTLRAKIKQELIKEMFNSSEEKEGSKTSTSPFTFFDLILALLVALVIVFLTWILFIKIR